MSTLVRFYFGTGPDQSGRTLAAIQDWDHHSLEQTHDYIQWLFPLPEPSQHNLTAPLLTTDDIEWFRTSRFLRRKLLASFELMLEFLGFDLTEDDGAPHVSCSGNFSSAKKRWLTAGNHNMARITRMLRSLTLLGLGEYARAFLRCLEELYEGEARQIITPATMQSWRDALANARPWSAM